MRELIRIAVVTAFVCLLSSASAAQDLVPGAYTPAPVGVNVVTIVASINDGDVAFDPSLPVEDGRATIGAAVVAYNRTLKIAGRFASVGVVAPYVLGHLQGTVLGQFQETSRSGMGDLSTRVAVNLFGAPAMTLKEFAGYRPATVFGVSLMVGVPVGQHDAARLVNIGTNRWTIKPDVGVSRTRGRWTLEGDLGMAFFTTNTNELLRRTYEQAPIVSMQGHLIYTIRPGFWVAGDGNFWSGGRVTTNGVGATARQQNSRLGATVALPIRARQFRIAYSFGAYTRLGGDFSSIGLSYSHAWIGRP